jgi:hypothetical protein
MMKKELLKHYLKVNLPPGIVFAVIYILGKHNSNIYFSADHNWIPVVLLMAAVFFAIVLPLWYRILFVRKKQGQKATEKNEFLRFEKKFLTFASVSIYILIAGYMTGLSKIPVSVMLLLVLYALYYYFPSEKRIEREKAIFKVKQNTDV